MSEDLDKKFQSGEALWESLGGFRILSWDATKRTLRASFTVRREYCHTNGTIAQGGFITAWMDAAMAHAVMYDTDNQFSVASLEIKVSFLERVGPGEGIAEGRVIRRGKRVAFLEAELFDAQGRMAAMAASTERATSAQDGIEQRHHAAAHQEGPDLLLLRAVLRAGQCGG